MAKQSFVTRTQILMLIGRINQSINQLTNEIMHHTEVQTLEARWRSLFQLTNEVADIQANSVKIKLFNVSFAELALDITQNVNNVEKTILFKKIYSGEFDQPGGEPYSIMLVDFEFHHKTKRNFHCVNVLRGLSKIASISFCPMVAAASSELCQLDSWSDCKPYHNYVTIQNQDEYTHWNSLIEEQQCQFLALTAPKTRVRNAYQQSYEYKQNYFFTENQSSHTDHLWGNNVYRYASAIITSFHTTGWFLNIEQTLDSLTNRDKKTTLLGTKIHSECLMTDTLEQELNQIGIITMRENNITHDDIFYAQPSLYTHSHKNENESDNPYTNIPYLLCACRLAQTLKFISRDKVGTFSTANECENWMNDWLLKYSSSSDAPLLETQLKYPIHKSKVKVSESKFSPGKYQCQISIAPHTLIDGVETTLQLMTSMNVSFNHEAAPVE